MKNRYLVSSFYLELGLSSYLELGLYYLLEFGLGEFFDSGLVDRLDSGLIICILGTDLSIRFLDSGRAFFSKGGTEGILIGPSFKLSYTLPAPWDSLSVWFCNLFASFDLFYSLINECCFFDASSLLRLYVKASDVLYLIGLVSI